MLQKAERESIIWRMSKELYEDNNLNGSADLVLATLEKFRSFPESAQPLWDIFERAIKNTFEDSVVTDSENRRNFDALITKHTWEKLIKDNGVILTNEEDDARVTKVVNEVASRLTAIAYVFS